jgi:hypothetical protein
MMTGENRNKIVGISGGEWRGSRITHKNAEDGPRIARTAATYDFSLLDLTHHLVRYCNGNRQAIEGY